MPAMTRSSGNSLTQRLIALVKEFMQFGMVGAAAYVIDVGLFNLLQHGPTGVLSGHPNSAQLLASSTATVFSWIANRYWTYRGRTQKNVAREATLFVLANLGGIAITQFCLLFTHHVLGLTSPLADNVAAYVVGFGLGTAFRFVFYHYIVFTGHPSLTRTAMPDDWVGHPQRKDYPLGGIPVEYKGAQTPPADTRRSYR